jgi:phage-related protein
LNLFELFVKIGAKDEASDKISAVSQNLGNGLKASAKIGLAAVSAAMAGISALTTIAVKEYAEYEQLVGGVETLFKESADIVLGYAENAYKSAGLSANDYMSTVTSFSASLLQSLNGDTRKAADYANRALIDMADNANKMGSDLSTLQTAYAGFAKGQFMLLDNLKLGYGGTQTEMQRLIRDAAEMTEIQRELGITVDVGSMSFANIVNAISVVQKSMGIMGATAEEAEKTISGSTAAMKAAFKNLLVGIADDTADFDMLINNMVDSATIALDNIMPRVRTAIGGVAKLIEQGAPIIIAEIPALAEEIIPAAIDGLMSIIGAAAEAAPALLGVLWNTIKKESPKVVESAKKLSIDFLNGLSSTIDEGIPEVANFVLDLVDQITDPVFLADLFDSGIKLITALWDGIDDAVNEIILKAPEIVDNLLHAILEYIKSGEGFGALVTKIYKQSVNGFFAEDRKQILVQAASKLVGVLARALVDAGGQILESGKEALKSFRDGLLDFVDDPKKWAQDIIDRFVQGIKEKIAGIKSFFVDIKDAFLSGWSGDEEEMPAIESDEDILGDIDDGEVVWEITKDEDGYGGGDELSTTINGMSINVNVGSSNASADEIADAVAVAMQEMLEGKKAAHG